MGDPVLFPLLLTPDEIRALMYMIRVAEINSLKVVAEAYTGGCRAMQQAAKEGVDVSKFPTEVVFEEMFIKGTLGIVDLFMSLSIPFVLAQVRGSLDPTIISITQLQFDKLREITSVKFVVDPEDTEDRRIHTYIEQCQPGIIKAMDMAENCVKASPIANHPPAPGFS